MINLVKNSIDWNKNVKKKNLIVPKKLQSGDKIATVSLSWGVAGDSPFSQRYKIGVERMKNLFGLKVIAMPNSLKSSDYLSKNPQARAEDLMQAFSDPKIKAIISNIGGNDTLRLHPFMSSYLNHFHRLYLVCLKTF